MQALSDGERDLGAMFDLSYAGLDERHRLLLRRLGLTSSRDADACVAAALLDTDPANATGLLEDLVDHNLLIEYAPGCYRVHDLLRAHACALADQDPPQDRRAALDRLPRHDAVAQTASLLIASRRQPNRRGSPQALLDHSTDRWHSTPNRPAY